MTKDIAIDTASVRAGRGPRADSATRSEPARSPQAERLLVALAGLWLLDGLLQLQPFMFTKDFAIKTIAPAAQNNPGWVAHPVAWAAGLIENHAIAANTLFALIQLALGAGIACRPTRRAALACSMVWAGSVWLLGEGLGGLFTGAANPLTGAPGSALLYMLAALLLWPGSATTAFPGAGRLGAFRSRIVWSALWLGLAFLTLLPVNRAASAFAVAMTGGMMTTGEPHWYTTLQVHLSKLTLGHETGIAITMALVLALIGACVWAPRPTPVRAGLVAAAVVAAVYWVCGQAFGMPFMGMATDPNSGPLLALLAACFWPAPTSPDAPLEGAAA
ncbi:hypothetical protein KDK95_28645 [Actinospica sp. MGRD01-02]|uniref:Uncharacterized protein n=1 Tax=Actinospica acidithermotolerans TaxID=2828514 RepID=A0A941EGQ0_9ACTN|nr:hypothetical protein [Actinospica acidithermotolerans]MBR7830305.1 hypothetical protein [Actinospica acidithermotolerans]